MLAADVELAHLDARHWRNWWRLLSPPGALDAPEWALAVRDKGVLIKLVVAGKGALDVTPHRTATAAELAKRLGVATVIALDRGVVATVAAEIEGALRPGMDGVAQALVALKAVKRHAKDIETEPALLDILPAPAYEPVQRTFDLLVPNNTALVAYVIEDDHTRVHASIIAVKDEGDIVRAATHRAIDDIVTESVLARDWHKGYKRVLDAVEERFAKPSIAVFLERATWTRVLTGPSDQLARELNSKNVVIDPAPAWLLGLLGGAAVAAMAGRAASAVAGMLPKSARDRASALAQRAQSAMKESGAHPFALLGFDPIELWQRLKHHYADRGGSSARRSP
jgi:hypothetical protein